MALAREASGSACSSYRTRGCTRDLYAAAVRWKVVPTLFWMKAPGRRRAIAWVAFQPVQWAGTITSGADCSSASDGVPDDRLERRAGQVETADDGVQLVHAGQALSVTADVDDARVPAAGEHDQPAPGDVGDQRLVVQDQRVRLPASAAPGLVDRESLLEAGGAVDLPGDQHRPVVQEPGCPCRDLYQRGEPVLGQRHVSRLAPEYRRGLQRRCQPGHRGQREPLRRALVRQRDLYDVVSQTVSTDSSSTGSSGSASPFHSRLADAAALRPPRLGHGHRSGTWAAPH